MSPASRTNRPARTDPVRGAAMDILRRVEMDGAYANILLEERTAGMSARDAAFCTTLTLGVLRRRAQLDWVLDRLLKRPIRDAPPAARHALRLGAYQILHLNVRKAAAVDEAVKLAKVHASANVGKLVNAVLRRLDPDAAFADLHRLDVSRVANWATLTGVPRWYAERVRDVWPGELGAYVCAAAAVEPPLTVRTNTARTTTEALRAAMREAGIGAAPHPIVPDMLSVFCPAPVLIGSAPFTEGLCHVQDGGSALAALALEPEPGQRVADLCAAPGGKAAVLAALVGETGAVIAVEKHPRRADRVRELAQRERLPWLRVVEGDATQPLPELETDSFDRVLVDAPCSALGIARHRPDLLWRDAPALERDILPTQRALLQRALQLLKPGGILVYSVCTFTPEEGPGVVAAVTESRTDITPGALPSPLDRWTVAPGHATIPPGAGNLDGFTVIRLRRTA